MGDIFSLALPQAKRNGLIRRRALFKQPALRRILLELLPKALLSRTTGLLTRIPLPRGLRGPLFRAFARRYGAALEQMQGNPEDYRSFAAFFRRPLLPDARPLGDTPLVWPCDGKVVTTGPIAGDRIPQIKGQDYGLEEFVGDAELAAALSGGSQATVYLAPGDYHRVHSPFDGELRGVRPIPGTLFPVNPPAVRAIPKLFVRNARHVLPCRLGDGRAAAVVLVGALNVGDTSITAQPGPVQRGQELGQFGFGSTAVVLMGPGEPSWPECPPDLAVAMGAGVSTPRP